MRILCNGKEKNIRRIGILTGGGDCAGLNAVIAGLLRRVHRENRNLPKDEQMELVGFSDGWKSLLAELEPELQTRSKSLELSEVDAVFSQSGTILGSSRTNIYSQKNVEALAPESVRDNLERLKIDCLCVLGGDDTLSAGCKFQEQFQFPVLGAPKTMDNDIFGTERTFGFESAYTEAARVIQHIKATAKSHHRIFVIEVMGRNAGWVALYAGIAGGAGVVCLPEEQFDFEDLAQRAMKMKFLWDYGTIVIAEGTRITSHEYPDALNNSNRKVLEELCKDPKYAVARARIEKPEKTDEFGHKTLSGVGEIIMSGLEILTPDIEYRFQNCGHAIRACEHPQDTILGLRFGLALFDCIKSGIFGYYLTLEADQIVPKPLAEARGGRHVSWQRYNDLFLMRNLIDSY